MGKTSVKTGWCENGLPITPEGTWRCSVCGEHVSTEDQKTKGGWFDYNNNGELGFVHVDCYQLCSRKISKMEEKLIQ